MRASLFDLIEEIARYSHAEVAVAIWNDVKPRLKEKFDQIDDEDEKNAREKV